MNDPSDISTHGRFRPRFALSTFLLFFAATAPWLASHQVAEKIEPLRRQMPGLKQVARELEIENPADFAVAGRIPEWYGENIFDLYVPSDGTYELCLALEKIDQAGLAEPVDRMLISQGVHAVEVHFDTQPDVSIITVLVDGEAKLQHSRSVEWDLSKSYTSWPTFSQSQQFPVSEPLVLHRKRFLVPMGNGSSQTPTEPSNGILVWIEPLKSESDATEASEPGTVDRHSESQTRGGTIETK